MIRRPRIWPGRRWTRRGAGGRGDRGGMWGEFPVAEGRRVGRVVDWVDISFPSSMVVAQEGASGR